MEHSIEFKSDLLEKVRIWIMILTAPVACYFSFRGYLEYMPEAGGWNAAYHTMQLFILHAPHNEMPLTQSLEIGRWLASITTIMAIINIVFYFFRTPIRVIKLRLMKNHTILCGLGEIGFAVAKNFPKKNKLVVIEKDTDNENISKLKKLGVKILRGNALDPALLEKAHISKARQVYALTGNDFDNLTIIKNLEKPDDNNGQKGYDLKISANIDSLNLKTAIRFERTICEKTCQLTELLNHFHKIAENKNLAQNEFDEEEYEAIKKKLSDYDPEKSPDYIEPKQKVKLFDINELCARFIFHKFPPDRFSRITENNAPPLRIHFLGFSQTGEELLKLCIQNCHYINRQNTVITLIDRDIDKFENKINNKCPQIGKVVKLDFKKMNPHHLTHKFVNDKELDKPDVIYICAGEDQYQVSYSVRAREIFGEKVHIVRWLTKDVIPHSYQFHDENIHTIDIMNTIATDDIITDFNVDKKAIATHHRWMKRDIQKYIEKVENALIENEEIPKPKETLVPWHLLQEEIRDDNRSVVEHNLIKIRSSNKFSKKIDFDNPENTVVDFSIINPNIKGLNENDLVWQLAEMEHRRWMATKFYYGWNINEKNIKERNKDKKIHPDLKDFTLLDEDTQEYDYKQILEIEDIWKIGTSITDSSTDQPKDKKNWLKKYYEFIKILFSDILKGGKVKP